MARKCQDAKKAIMARKNDFDNPAMRCGAVLQTWQFHVTHAQTTYVFPDGCRDVLITSKQGGHDRLIQVTALDTHAYAIACSPGDWFLGYRLHPAARFDEPGMLADLADVPHGDQVAVERVLAKHVWLDERLEEALTGIARSIRMTSAGRLLGVSTRTLQRLITGATGHPPAFWRALVRWRCAARAVMMECTAGVPLAEVAAQYGYADQAHMNREFKRWFAMTPGVFLSHHHSQEVMAQSGCEILSHAETSTR